MFALDGVELVFEPEALESIADQALERGTGARGLRAIMEEVLLPVMFDLPSREDIATVVISGAVVDKTAEPTLISHDVVAKRRNKSA
jgi:ATP-dependent Clp protease ATP-binding subunit ClpX